MWSKISRLELGQSGIKLTDLNLLLDFYGVSGEQTDWMRDLARTGRQRGRWSSHRSRSTSRNHTELSGSPPRRARPRLCGWRHNPDRLALDDAWA